MQPAFHPDAPQHKYSNMKDIPNNYRENPIRYYKEELLNVSAEDAAERLGLKQENDSVYLSILGTGYRINIPSFEFECLDPDRPDYLKGQAAQVLILHLLTECRIVPSSGRFISYREYPSGDLYYKAFEGRCLKRLAFSYGTRVEAFKKDCAAAGAEAIEGGDAAFKIVFMPGLELKLILWGPDEEFPPSAQILFSDNFPAALSAEGASGLCDIVISAIKAAGKK